MAPDRDNQEDGVIVVDHRQMASEGLAETGARAMSGHLSSGVLNEEASKPGGGSLVLVIEDDPALTEEIHLGLEAGGHIVQVAETLTEGLRAARSGEVGVLVIDRVLEGAPGREQPGHLEDAQPDHAGVPNQLEHHVLRENAPSLSPSSWC